MIQIVGLLVAVYAVARLLQVPIEHSAHHRKDIWLWVIALVGMLFLFVEIRWHARQRQEPMHLLIYSLCRLSKKQTAALAEELRRSEGTRSEASGAATGQLEGKRFAPSGWSKSTA